MSSSEVEVLKATFSVAASRDKIAAALVVVGVLMELVALLFEETPAVKRYVNVPATLLIALGVAGELLFGGTADAAASQLQRVFEHRVAELQGAEAHDQKIASKAAAHAADLGVTLGNLQSFVKTRQALAERSMSTFSAALRANEKSTATAISRLNADRANLERVQVAANESVRSANHEATLAKAEVAQVQADVTQVTALLSHERALDHRLVVALNGRTLSPAQASVMARQMARFAPLRANIFVLGDAVEMANLGLNLQRTLSAAGWTVKLWTVVNTTPPEGVEVFTRRGTGEKVQSAAAALVSYLSAAQIRSSLGGDFADSAAFPLYGIENGPPWSGDAAVRIFVGAK